MGRFEPPFVQGRSGALNGKEIELDRPITRAEYLSGSCFGDQVFATSGPSTLPKVLSKQFIPLKPRPLPAVKCTGPGQPQAPESKGVPLQPVNLLSSLENSSPKPTISKVEGEEDSHWTANWCANT